MSFRLLSTILCASLAVFGCDGADPVTDAGSAVDSGPPGSVDASPGGDTDAGTRSCFPLSGPSFDLPDAIPSAFDATSPTWMRPTGETCPATGLGATAVPYDEVCYVNDTGAELGVTWEVVVGDSDLRPAAIIYDGATVPSDRTQCAAVSSDLVIDAAEAYYVVPTGAEVTFVATTQEPGEGTFQFVITPD